MRGTPLANDRYQRIKEVFCAAFELQPSQRDAFLERACGVDAQLRLEVQQLIAIEQSHRDYLERPLLGGTRFLAEVAQLQREQIEPVLPVRIGRYQVVRLIAEGGMGSVYLARQDSPSREVALKVIRDGALSRSTMQRFEQEVEFLGRLRHPGIAQIHDAGVAELERTSGITAQVPYFAMEFVDGASLLDYATSHGLALHDRLSLLAQVCDAVHFGHQHGVVHRDLKPSNVLVDGSGRPKVIDFGVARATDSDVELTMLQTDAGQIVGTLAYMSPEQVSGQRGQVDTRSDIYSLGVLGYELLTGRLPYDLTGTVVPEAARIIREEEPSRLSSISRDLRGDVENIIAQALQKEPARRYPSAVAMAEDIRRSLRHQPIIARSPTLRYQLSKFARRHKEFVAGLALVFVVLLLGIIGTTAALLRAEAEGKRAIAAKTIADEAAAAALHEAHKTQRLNEVLQQVLSYARPGMAGGGRDVKLVEMLDLVSEDLMEQLEDVPEIEFEARRTLGRTYERMGLYDRANRHFSRALELATQSYGADAAVTLEVAADMVLTQAWFVETQADRDRREDNLIFAEERLTKARAVLGGRHLSTQRLLMAAARLRAQSFQPIEAEAHLRELLEVIRSVAPQQRAFSESDASGWLVQVLHWQFRFAEAEALVHQLIDAERCGAADVNVESPPERRLAAILVDTKRLNEAVGLYEGVLDRQRRVLGDLHPETLDTANSLAFLLVRMDRFTEALEWFEFERSGYERTFPERDWIASLFSYEGRLLDRLRRGAESPVRFTQAIERRRAKYGDDALAEEWWRAAVAGKGGFSQPWAGTAVQRQARSLIDAALRAAPTRSFDLEEIDWSRLHFAVTRWSGDTEVNMAQGSLNQLRALPDPAPGLYRLHLDVPRRGGEPIAASEWLLVAPWQFDVFDFRSSREQGWANPVLFGPHERRVEPALLLVSRGGPFEDHMGPAGAYVCFSIHAAASIDLPAGRYRFHAVFDDGARIWFDDRLVVDQWTEVSAHDGSFPFEVDLDGGKHDLRVEYFQHGQTARLWIRAEPVVRSGATVRDD